MSRFPKLRFSLLTLLLSTIIVALGISFYFVQRRAATLSAENQLLRDELGFIEVKDPTKSYCREIASHAPLTWRYRIYVPDTGEWNLGIAFGDINELGEIPASSSTTNSESGQFEIVVSVAPIGIQNLGTRISVGHNLGLLTAAFYQGEADWILEDEDERERQRFRLFAGGENKTIEIDAFGKVELMSIYNAEQTKGMGVFLQFREQKEDANER